MPENTGELGPSKTLRIPFLANSNPFTRCESCQKRVDFRTGGTKSVHTRAFSPLSECVRGCKLALARRVPCFVGFGFPGFKGYLNKRVFKAWGKPSSCAACGVARRCSFEEMVDSGLLRVARTVALAPDRLQQLRAWRIVFYPAAYLPAELKAAHIGELVHEIPAMDAGDEQLVEMRRESTEGNDPSTKMRERPSNTGSNPWLICWYFAMRPSMRLTGARRLRPPLFPADRPKLSSASQANPPVFSATLNGLSATAATPGEVRRRLGKLVVS